MGYAGGFRWLLTEKEVNNIGLAKHEEDSKKGVILEVDLEYPQSYMIFVMTIQKK